MNVASRLFGDLVRVAPAEMSVRQAALLVLLVSITGPHTVRGSAARLQVAKPVITRAITQMERWGLAYRVSDPHDGRNVFLRPTDKGIELVALMNGQAAKPAGGV